MGVRVLVEVKRGGEVTATPALINSGYEAYEPEIHVPLALAKKLGFKLEELRGEKYKVVGTEVTAYALGEIYARVVTEDKVTGWVKADAVTTPGEYEVIISDTLTEKLQIEIIKPKTGLWKFHGEEKTRESVESRYWIE